MDNHNLNSTYLNSDAVANYMQIADQAVGDGNNMLSVDELAQFFNQTIFTWVNSNPPVDPATGQQLRDLLPSANHNNLAHFDVYFAIGYFFLLQHNNPHVNANYSTLVNQFNNTYGVGGNPGNIPTIPPPQDLFNLGPPQPLPNLDFTGAQSQAPAPTGPCDRPNPNAPYRAYPQQPERYDDCRNCNDDDIISGDPIQDIPLEELFMLPSGNCMRGEDIQRIINEPHPDRRVDPWSRQALTGGKKRRSRKAKKTKKSRKTKKSKKSRKSRKVKKSRKARKA